MSERGVTSGETGWRFTENQPGLAIFLVDQSVSMHLSYNVGGISSADRATRIVNQTIANAISHVGQDPVTQATPHVCDVAIWAYSENSWPVAPNGGLPVALGYLADYDRRGPWWQEKPAQPTNPTKPKLPWTNAPVIGQTGRWIPREFGGPGSNLVDAISTVTKLVEDWLANPIYPNHHSSAPPIVIHISDGAHDRSSDRPSALQEALQNLRALHTDVGPLCFVNVGLTTESAAAQIFPDHSGNLARTELYLWHISSPLPEPMLRLIRRRYAGQAKRLPWFKRIAQEDAEIDRMRHAYLSHPDEMVIADLLSAMLA